MTTYGELVPPDGEYCIVAGAMDCCIMAEPPPPPRTGYILLWPWRFSPIIAWYGVSPFLPGSIPTLLSAAAAATDAATLCWLASPLPARSLLSSELLIALPSESAATLSALNVFSVPEEAGLNVFSVPEEAGDVSSPATDPSADELDSEETHVPLRLGGVTDGAAGSGAMRLR